MKVEIERDVSHLQKEMLQEQRRIKLRRSFRIYDLRHRH